LRRRTLAARETVLLYDFLTVLEQAANASVTNENIAHRRVMAVAMCVARAETDLRAKKPISSIDPRNPPVNIGKIRIRTIHDLTSLLFFQIFGKYFISIRCTHAMLYFNEMGGSNQRFGWYLNYSRVEYI
jgi:hypothetical protein